MPNIKILPDLEGESFDTPKFFTNIDKEDFEFTWDSIPYIVKAGETKSFPKYLVNNAAGHLSRKIVKREAIEKVPEEQRSHIHIRFVNPKKEEELQKQIVAKNYPEIVVESIKKEKKEVKATVKEEVDTNDKVTLKCDVCGAEFENLFSLKAHKISVHSVK